MHENEEAPEGYMEKEKEKEKRENWVAEREEMYWVLKRVDREREREGGSREDATTPTNF
jgi:hypothetical protein